MKKITSAILFCCLITILSGCGNSEEKASSSTNKEEQALKKENAKLPSRVFESDRTKETISKSEIHKSIQKYLDTNERVYSFTSTIDEKVWDEKPLTKKEADHLEKGRALLKKNDQNFSAYIENNKLPEGYQKETNRVSEYFTAYNHTIEQLGDKVQEIENETKNVPISIKEIKDIMPEKSKVNGRQQDKIEKFLKKINVKTNAFEM